MSLEKATRVEGWDRRRQRLGRGKSASAAPGSVYKLIRLSCFRNSRRSASMDDIVWIREEAPAEAERTTNGTSSDLNTLNGFSEGYTVDDDGSVEIPVIIEQNSTDVPFYKKNPTQGSTIPVEVYDPNSTTVPVPALVDLEVPVEVYDPTSTTVPAYLPVEVEVFDPTSTEIPVIIDHNTPEVKNEADKAAGELKPAEPEKPAEPQKSAVGTAQNQTNEKAKEDEGFDISEYERKLNDATQGAKELVNKLCDKSEALNQNAQSIANNVADQKRYLIEDVHKTIEDIDQMPPPPELPTGGLPKAVESIIIGQDVVTDVTGCIVLPNGTILATDEKEGLILFDTQGNVLRKVNNIGWRKPRSPVYYKEHILMLIDMQEDGTWTRYIFKFTVDIEFVARIEGPKWIRDDKTVISERLSIAHTDYLYLSICGEVFSALYELTPVGQWTELLYRLSESYVDMLAFAVIGPITQVLIVEGRKNYVLQMSVRESEVVSRHRLAVCERPGAMARDEAGRLFVANRSTATIQLVDTVRWSTARNVALTDSMVPHFSASWGLLAIPLKGAIRLHRYSFRLGK